jgi:hypothetical protein
MPGKSSGRSTIVRTAREAVSGGSRVVEVLLRRGDEHADGRSTGLTLGRG